MGNMKFKVGDRVRIKSIDWYNKNKDNNREIKFENGIFTTLKSTFLGQIMTIEEITLEKQYILMEDMYKTLWTDEMIEGLAKDEMSLDKAGQITDFEYEGLAYTLPDGYQFVDENGNEILTSKIILEKKKKEYPKTYKECCEVLGLNDLINMHLGFMDEDTKIIASTNYHIKTLILLNCLTKLRICRDAYWKIAGDEMGLEKPWKLSIGTPIYYIYYNRTVGTIKNDYADDIQGNIILAFPTAEMRNAFYENFKELIESCKELL